MELLSCFSIVLITHVGSYLCNRLDPFLVAVWVIGAKQIKTLWLWIEFKGVVVPGCLRSRGRKTTTQSCETRIHKLCVHNDPIQIVDMRYYDSPLWITKILCYLQIFWIQKISTINKNTLKGRRWRYWHVVLLTLLCTALSLKSNTTSSECKLIQSRIQEQCVPVFPRCVDSQTNDLWSLQSPVRIWVLVTLKVAEAAIIQSTPATTEL